MVIILAAVSGERVENYHHLSMWTLETGLCLWGAAQNLTHHHYPPRLNATECGSILRSQVVKSSVAVFGVSNEIYLPKYFTALSSLECTTFASRESKDADLFLLMHDTARMAKTTKKQRKENNKGNVTYPGSSVSRWEELTPRRLKWKVSFIPVDLSSRFSRSTYHASWPAVAYWWTMGPELFLSLGYAHAVYLDGDVLAHSKRSGGGFSCGLLRSELVPLLKEEHEEGEERLVAGAIESPLGIMLAALARSGGGGDDSGDDDGGVEALLEPHALLGISPSLLLLPEHALTVNTGVLVFSCATAGKWRLLEAATALAERCAKVGIAPLMGDMHLFGLLLMLVARHQQQEEGGGGGGGDSSSSSSSSSSTLDLVSIVQAASSIDDSTDESWVVPLPAEPLLQRVLAPLPALWNYRFNRNTARVTVDEHTGALSFQYERGPEFEVCGDGGDVFSTCDGDGDDSALRLVHFTWAKPWSLVGVDDVNDDESMKDMDPDLWDPQRRRFTMHWRAARERAKGLLGGGGS